MKFYFSFRKFVKLTVLLSLLCVSASDLRAQSGSISEAAADSTYVMPEGPLSSYRQNYIGLFIASQHFGNDELNNLTPGLTLGRRWQKNDSGLELFVEGGIFYNSYDEVSPLVVAGISTRLFAIAGGELRIGASAGTAYYDELSESLEDEYGIPNLGGFIPIVSLTTSWRKENIEYRLTLVPPDTDTTAIVNASITFAF